MQSIREPYDPTAWIVPLERFIEYGLWFQERTSPDVDRRDVQHLAAASGEFALTLSDGEEVKARRVVLAVGIRDFAHIPPELSSLPAELMSHSSLVSDPKRLAGRDVTVLGGGSSAIDLTMLLLEAGASTRLVARAPRLNFHSGDQGRRSAFAKLRRPTSGVGPGWRNLFVAEAPGLFAYLPARMRLDQVRRMLGPAAGRGVRERVEGKVPLLVNHWLVGARPRNGGLSISLNGPEGTTEFRTEHLISATGYRPDVSRLRFLSPSLMERISVTEGAPRLGFDFQSSVPGLYFVGLAAAYRFGPVQRFAYGAGFAARTVAAALS